MKDPTLDDLSEAEQIITGECVKSTVSVLLRHLKVRRQNVSVRGIDENSILQAVALGGLYHRLRELYPPETQEKIELLAQQLSATIGRR